MVQLRKVALSFVTLFFAMQVQGTDIPQRVLELPPGPNNPRNSEGAFATLKNGDVLLIYSRFNGQGGGDDDGAVLASRLSKDGGRTWSKQDKFEVPNEGKMNVMSVSLLRLASGRLALFYLLKNGEADCRPVMRISTDEGQTWGAPTVCIADKDVAYYVLNNDRSVQLKSGRIVLPLARHRGEVALAIDCLSDDEGKTWRLGKPVIPLKRSNGNAVDEQEPGVVELRDSRLMMFIRNELGSIAFCYSHDRGETWSAPALSDLKAPLAPASLKRLPDGNLLLVWNDHGNLPDAIKWHKTPRWACGRRIPLTVAISRDEGKTWTHRKVLEGCLDGWYCYTAIHPVGDFILLGYSSTQDLNCLRVTRIPTSWFYEEAPRSGKPPLNGFFND